MHAMHVGADDEKIVMAIMIVVTVLSLISYIMGFLYDGIRNRNWSIADIFSNPAKAIGGFLLCFMTVIWIACALVMEIYKYL